MIGTFRTKSGKSFHREGCRFLKGDISAITESTPKTRTLKACMVCKPHLDVEAFTKLSKAKTIPFLGACGVCKTHMAEKHRTAKYTPQDAESHGMSVTRTGTKFHNPLCKHAGGPGFGPKHHPVSARQVGNHVPLMRPEAVAQEMGMGA